MQKKEDIRCGECNRLLARGTAASISIKCPRCGTINHITVSDKSANQDSHEPPNAVSKCNSYGINRNM